VIWTLSVVAFLVLAALSLAGLLLAPSLIVPGINGVRSGATTNGGLDIDRVGWTFVALAPGSTGGRASIAGNGFLEMSAPTPAGSEMIGYWWQSFDVDGAAPFVAIADLDVQISLGDNASRGILAVYVQDNVAVPIVPPIGTLEVTVTSPWIHTPRFLSDDVISAPGRYYVLIAFTTAAVSPGSATTVGVDNIRLVWGTDAGIVLYVALPLPVLVYRSQDPTLFLTYYGFLIAAIVAAAVYHAVRERRETLAAFRAPIGAVRARLGSRSAWVAVAQVFLAMNFFQIALIFILEALGYLPESPFEITSANVWTYLYELANASVYEEIVFRMLLIGVPMALGSVVLRAIDVSRSGGTWRGGDTPARHIAGAARYLFGGAVRRTSSKETLLASWAFLLASSAIFGLAHLPGWGWWKVAPSFVAGLGLGYLFLRHGVGAAILAHFVNDYAFSLPLLGYGGVGLEVFLTLFFLALSAAGSGFFVWYALVAWGHARDLYTRFVRPPVRPGMRPVAPSEGSGAPLVPGSASPAPGAPAGSWPAPPVATSAPQVRGGSPAGLPSGYAPTYRPPPYGYPPVRFQCPSCGWVEARYDAGRFTCGRCGNVF
jgi:hypothetical protein